MLSSVALRGLYAITDGNADELVQRTAAAIAGGARVIQYRDKSNDPQRRATPDQRTVGRHRRSSKSAA